MHVVTCLYQNFEKIIKKIWSYLKVKKIYSLRPKINTFLRPDTETNVWCEPKYPLSFAKRVRILSCLFYKKIPDILVFYERLVKVAIFIWQISNSMCNYFGTEGVVRICLRKILLNLTKYCPILLFKIGVKSSNSYNSRGKSTRIN